MNKKFKNRNRGLVTFGIVALSAVALTASGFAAWVISGADAQTGGNIQVDTVQNNVHPVSVQLTKGKDNIAFGSVTEGNVATWLKNDNTPEQLDVEATVTVSNVTTTISSSNVNTVLKNPTLTIKKGEEDYTAKYNAIADGTATSEGLGADYASAESGLVGAIPSLTYSSISYSNTTLTCKVVFSFKWGKLFNSQNPCLYYYGKTAATSGAEAQRRLETIHSTLNGCNYVLTIESL